MKLVIVTGASKGLGLSICNTLLESGYNVLGISRSKTTRFESLHEKYNKNLYFENYDFNNVNDLHNLAKLIKTKYGKVYGLVNNAALGSGSILATMHNSEISQLIKVNLEAPIILTKYICRDMLKHSEGRVINISSIIASTGFNGLSVYGATKSALIGFTKSLARELGKANITVNSISPGYMKTKMTEDISSENLNKIINRSPLKTLVSEEDISNMVLHLLSEKSSRITGANFIIDAGSTC